MANKDSNFWLVFGCGNSFFSYWTFIWLTSEFNVGFIWKNSMMNHGKGKHGYKSLYQRCTFILKFPWHDWVTITVKAHPLVSGGNLSLSICELKWWHQQKTLLANISQHWKQIPNLVFHVAFGVWVQKSGKAMRRQKNHDQNGTFLSNNPRWLRESETARSMLACDCNITSFLL